MVCTPESPQSLYSRLILEVSLMVTYLTARIETAHVGMVKETALGLRALVAMSHFNTNDAIDICHKIFSSGPHFNENSATARFEVYKLIDLFLNAYRDTLKGMEGEFINGIISLAELEKDPRCLMVYFSIISVILAEWDIQEEVKDLWESVSRYYPITFRVKPDDPIGITPNELKLRLRMCIAATSEFAPMAFPFLIEKLDYQVTANVKVSRI
jgi:DNA repair/transcription protein MET18/MMS19